MQNLTNDATKVSGEQILNVIILDTDKGDNGVLNGADNNPINTN